ncbi:MAG: ParB/RepB/Spo0J family partition protein [Magnetococcales bacterium]|nr:ParB/RepB/Spo0J family partition protein [Magnetococcales bacterium]
MNVQEITVENIIEFNRLREVDRDVVEGLVTSIQANGLQQPIQVRNQPLAKDRFILISGAHRLAACRKIGMPTVPCVVTECSDLEARMMEVDENLIRYELTPFDRAAFLAERKKIYEEMYPQTKAGVAGAIAKHHGSEKTDNTDSSANAIVAFAETTAEKLKLSRRTVESAIRMHRDLSPKSKVAIAGTWLARSGKDLEMLSRQTPEIQEKVLNLIASVTHMEKPGGVAKALDRIIGKGEPVSAMDGAEKQYWALLRLWGEAPVTTRNKFISWLDEHHLLDHLKGEKEVS